MPKSSVSGSKAKAAAKVGSSKASPSGSPDRNVPLRMDGRDLLAGLGAGSVPVVFFDPQYRGVLDKLNYGNEGVSRGKGRSSLAQMGESTIMQFLALIDKALRPGGHLFLWVDKFHLCSGIAGWFGQTSLEVVDMVTWCKDRMGMGYRTRRVSEFLLVVQKPPKRARGTWQDHGIKDVWTEKVARGKAVHPKPVKLQARLIGAVTKPGDLVVDPAAGSFSVLAACQETGREFLGADLDLSWVASGLPKGEASANGK